jgi:micrococcal nuclease
MKILLCLLLSLYVHNYKEITHEPVIVGKVVSITDGDTFTILTSNNKSLKIRLYGIDAPEKGQDFYQSSKAFLGNLLDKSSGVVHVTIKGKDKYGRTIGDVYNTNNLHINLLLVKNGMAWHYIKYSSDSILASAEQLARRNKSGLWKLKNPIAPWDFRKNKRRKNSTDFFAKTIPLSLKP